MTSHTLVNPITDILDAHGVMILDGALATELERRGCDLDDPLWSAKVLLEAPELIKAVHASYFEAGADCATTATYQATFRGFARRGFSEAEATGLLRSAVRLAIEARDEFWADRAHRPGRPHPLVAASIGPYGAFLADGSEYRGDYGLSAEELREFHRPRMTVLAESGADLLACETIPCLLEAQVLAELLSQFPGVSAWISFSARDSLHTSHGERLADCAAVLNQFDAVAAIGINCTAPQFIPGGVDALRSATDKPIVVYPNSGERYDTGVKCWTGPAETATYLEGVRTWYEHGARIIGGCCRTTPVEIRALVSLARSGDR